jgi:hypothetical protein
MHYLKLLKPLSSNPLNNEQFRELSPGPNLSLNSDPACIVFRSLSRFRYLGSAQHLGTVGAG